MAELASKVCREVVQGGLRPAPHTRQQQQQVAQRRQVIPLQLQKQKWRGVWAGWVRVGRRRGSSRCPAPPGRHVAAAGTHAGGWGVGRMCVGEWVGLGAKKEITKDCLPPFSPSSPLAGEMLPTPAQKPSPPSPPEARPGSLLPPPAPRAHPGCRCARGRQTSPAPAERNRDRAGRDEGAASREVAVWPARQGNTLKPAANIQQSTLEGMRQAGRAARLAEWMARSPQASCTR